MQTGADIVAVARDSDGLQEVATQVKEMGRECLIITADLFMIDGPKKVAEQALAEWDTIDILVNCAGIAGSG